MANNTLDILGFLEIMEKDSSARLMLDSPDFKYSRVTSEKTESVPVTDCLRFVSDPAPEGYSIGSINVGSMRSNISINIRKHGTVDLSSVLPSASDTIKASLSPIHKTYVHRTYTIVRDGVLNVDTLPVRLNAALYSAAGFPSQNLSVDVATGLAVGVLDLRMLPLVSDQLKNEISAKTLLTLEWELTKARSTQKVYNHYMKSFSSKEEKSEVDAWLESHGITSSGFFPKTTDKVAAQGFEAKIVDVSIKGYSSIPTIKDVQDRMTKSKPLTGCAVFMAPVITDCENLIKTSEGISTLAARRESLSLTIDNLLRRTGLLKYAVKATNKWFPEFSCPDDTVLNMTLEGVALTGTFDIKTVKV